MASIQCDGKRGELKRIMFRDSNGKQKALRLGKCSEKNALHALSAMEHLLEAREHESAPHYDAVRWLDKISDRIHARVVALGLAQPRRWPKSLAEPKVKPAKEMSQSTAAETIFHKTFDVGSDRSFSVVLPRIDTASIYFLIRNSVVIYVGQSRNMLARIGKHYDGVYRYGAKENKIFDRVEVIEVDPRLVNETETFFIMYYLPEYNIGMPPCSVGHLRVQEVAKSYGCELRKVNGTEIYMKSDAE